jgi:hypothetical protein
MQLFMVLCTVRAGLNDKGQSEAAISWSCLSWFSRSAAHVNVEEPRLCVHLKGSERSVSIGNDIDIETVHEPIGCGLSQRKRDGDDGVVLILNGRAR